MAESQPTIPRPPSAQPLPADAELVFKGVVFDVYQWQQELYDGSRRTFEKLRRRDTVVVIPVTEQGTILMTEQEQPGKRQYLGFAGGQVEEGEEVMVAAERELLEETGYAAASYRLLFADQPYSKIEWAYYVLVAKGCRRVAGQHPEAGERITLKEVEFEELLGLAQREDFHEVQIALLLLRAAQHPEQLTRLRHAILG